MLEMCLSGENNGIVHFSGRPEGHREIDYSVRYETVFAFRVNKFLSFIKFFLILKPFLILTN